jgi:hypothetical protein
MGWEGSTARSVLIAILIVASLGTLACGGSSPSSPTDSTTTPPTTVLYTPKVTGVDPTSGAEAGGTVVTITGEYFTTSSVVKIGGSSATSVTYISATELQATTPAGTPGAADVTVTVGSLTGKLTGGFSYLGAVDCALTFTVYNHTAGRLGAWTATLPSGSQVTLAIGSLGEVVDGDGNVVQAAIPVDSADSQRMVVRKGAANGRVGAYVGASASGTVTFQVPIATSASYDVFVMNAQNGTDYGVLDTGALAYNRTVSVSRGADVGGASGPDDAIDALVRALSEAVTYPWMSYGRVVRTAVDGEIFVVYTEPNAGACVTYTRAKGMMYVNPERCAAVPVDLYGSIVENGIEMLAGVKDIGGPDSAGLLYWDSLKLTPTGRDLLAYVFLKDTKDW